MIKLFLSRKIEEMKRSKRQFKEQWRLMTTVFPATCGLASLALFGCIGAVIVECVFPNTRAFSEIVYATKSLFAFFEYIIHLLLKFIGNRPYLTCSILAGVLIFKSFITEFRKQARFPIIGIPNKDKVNILLLLFKVRCKEIATIYAIVRHAQKNAVCGNWVKLFLDEYFNKYTKLWDYTDEKKRELQEHQNQETIALLLKENFNFSHGFFGYEVQNLVIAFKQEHDIYNIEALCNIWTYGFLKNTITALIKEYNRFNSRSSAISIFDKFRFLKRKIVKSHKVIDVMWEEIIASLRSALVFLKSQNDTTFNIEEILAEIDALNRMQDDIPDVMRKKNTEDREYMFRRTSKEQEELIISQMSTNPINKFYE
jgi:hypothetical protein